MERGDMHNFIMGWGGCKKSIMGDGGSNNFQANPTIFFKQYTVDQYVGKQSYVVLLNHQIGCIIATVLSLISYST